MFGFSLGSMRLLLIEDGTSVTLISVRVFKSIDASIFHEV